MLRSAGRTDTGCCRDVNEDTFGLWKLVDDARMAAIIGQHPDPAAACAALIAAANAAGGPDNIVAVTDT